MNGDVLVEVNVDQVGSEESDVSVNVPRTSKRIQNKGKGIRKKGVGGNSPVVKK